MGEAIGGHRKNPSGQRIGTCHHGSRLKATRTRTAPGSISKRLTRRWPREPPRLVRTPTAGRSDSLPGAGLGCAFSATGLLWRGCRRSAHIVSFAESVLQKLSRSLSAVLPSGGAANARRRLRRNRADGEPA